MSHSQPAELGSKKYLIPDAKVVNTLFGTDAALVISYFLGYPPEVSLAIATLIGLVIGYFTPRRTNIDHDKSDLSGL